MKLLAVLVFLIGATPAFAADREVCFGRFHERCFDLKKGSLSEVQHMGPMTTRKLSKKAETEITQAIDGFAKMAKDAKRPFTKLSMCGSIVTIKAGKLIDSYCLDKYGDKGARQRRDELLAKLR